MIDIQKRKWDMPPFIIHIQDYRTHISFEDTYFSDCLFINFSKPDHTIRPLEQDLLVTHYDFEEIKQKNMTKLCNKPSHSM